MLTLHHLADSRSKATLWLLEELGGRYVEALAEHRRIVREACARHGGVEVDTAVLVERGGHRREEAAERGVETHARTRFAPCAHEARVTLCRSTRSLRSLMYEG